MKLYHYTNRAAFNGISLAGRVLPRLCRTMYHPVRSEQEGQTVYEPALWAMSEPLPQKWRDFQSGKLDLRELFFHTNRGRVPVLLEMAIPEDADVWAADWAERLKDMKLNDDMGFFDSPRYYGSMKRYTGPDVIENMALPEIICFGHIPADRFTEVPLPDQLN